MILITGGTGFVGRHLASRLLRAGETVRVLGRDPDKAELLIGQGVEFAQGDVTNPASLRRAMERVTAVAHLVAVIREMGDYTFDSVNVQGTRNLLEAAKEAGVRRLLHMSALGASDNPRFKYTYSKWLGEEAVRQSGLDYTIFRPSVIFGEGFGFINRIVQSIKMAPPFAPVPGSGRARFQPIWVDDVATCFLKALKDPVAVGQTYEIGGPEHLTHEQILDMAMKTLGVKRFKVHIPLLAMLPVSLLMDIFLPDPPVTPIQLKQLKVNNTTALNSVERSFGFRPKKLAEGLDYIRPRREEPEE